MSEIYCISYSDFGYLLTDWLWSISIVKLEDCDYGVFEDVLKADDIVIRRRFLGNVPSLFEDSSEFKSEPQLPSDVERFLMTYHGIEAIVVSSYDFDRLFSNKSKDSSVFVKAEKSEITLKACQQEDLAEDVVLLASNGIDLNNTDSL